MGEVNSKSTKAELLEHIKQQDKELKASESKPVRPKAGSRIQTDSGRKGKDWRRKI